MLKSLPRCALHIARRIGHTTYQHNRTLKKNSRGSRTSPHHQNAVRSTRSSVGNKQGSQSQRNRFSGMRSAEYLEQSYGMDTNNYFKGEAPRKFEDYWSKAKVKNGLKDGTLVQGTIRMNKKNPDLVFVTPLDGSPDIFLPDSYINKNRALQGDIVAVQLTSQPDKVLMPGVVTEVLSNSGKGFDGSSEDVIKDIKDVNKEAHRKHKSRAGKVVYIMEKKHPRICTGYLEVLHGDRIFFNPLDVTLPPLFIPNKDLPQDLYQHKASYSKTLFVARILDWKTTDMRALGKLEKTLGDRGELETETEGILIDNQVNSGNFTQAVIDCLPKQTPWSIPPDEYKYRRDLRSSCIFTIDPSTARDIDDALSCEDLGNGQYRVGVHIADVSYFVKENTELDKAASERSTSYYLVQKAIPMLPKLLSEELCSLNPDTERLAFSVEWIITENGKILKEWYGRSVIKSCVKLSYDQAQVFIDEPNKEWNDTELPPISKPFSPRDVSVRVQNLQKLALKLRKNRFDSGSLRLDKMKLQFRLDGDTGLPNGCFVYEHKDSNRLIEEFMLLANMTVARIIKEKYPRLAVLRRHEPPKESMLEDLKKLCSRFGINIDISSAGSIQRSLDRYEGADDFCQSRMQVLIAFCTKPIKLAKYFCAGTLEDESQYVHYALNVPLYTHFTSPIRRYPDILVHRLLGATLGYCNLPSLTVTQLQKVLDHANVRREASKKVDEKSIDLFFAAFLKTVGPIAEKAMIMAVNKRAVEIFILRFGVKKSVAFKEMPNLLVTQPREEQKQIEWKPRNGTEPTPPKFDLFSELDCVLQYSADDHVSSRWKATIFGPSEDSNSMSLANDYIDKLNKENSGDLSDSDDDR